jgi:hypothetical protein
MKKIMLMSVLALGMLSAKAQDYKAPLKATVDAFDTSKELNDKVQLSNKLTLIAKKWDREWATHYYASFSKAVLSYLEKDANKRDAYLDEADKEHDDAVSILGKETDETYVLGAMIANARLAVDPMNRWQKYGQTFSSDLESAKELNPNNPRMYYLQGTSKFYTPKTYGGGKKAAQPYFEKAQGLYAAEKDDDINKPYWGKRLNAYYLQQCVAGE